MQRIGASARSGRARPLPGLNGAALAGQEFARAFGGWFVLGVLVALVSMLLTESGSLDDMFSLRADSSALPLEGIEKGALFLISPVVVALPHSTSYVSDHRSRYLRYLLPRCGWRSFAAWRFVANALAGAMCVFVAQALLVGFACVAYPYADVPYGYVNAMNWFQRLWYESPMNYVLMVMAMQLPCHVARASTALAVSPWVRNPFAPLIAPLIFDNALSMLSGGSEAIAWLRARSVLPLELVFWGSDMANVYWYLAIAAIRTALCAAIFYVGVRRNAYK